MGIHATSKMHHHPSPYIPLPLQPHTHTPWIFTIKIHGKTDKWLLQSTYTLANMQVPSSKNAASHKYWYSVTMPTLTLSFKLHFKVIIWWILILLWYHSIPNYLILKTVSEKNGNQTILTELAAVDISNHHDCIHLQMHTITKSVILADLAWQHLWKKNPQTLALPPIHTIYIHACVFSQITTHYLSGLKHNCHTQNA